ncbi:MULTISPECIES: hypothetical protein [unclassified Myroides]|uniref:hypothetical protein n=1 Tax=unclassified Myroides TaxID=2642485 RepID=UPI003D2F782B
MTWLVRSNRSIIQIFGYREPLYEIIPGFMLSGASIVILSYFSKPVTKAIQVSFDTAQALYRKEK